MDNKLGKPQNALYLPRLGRYKVVGHLKKSMKGGKIVLARCSRRKLGIALVIVLLTTSLLVVGCQNNSGTTTAEPTLADELILYNWADYMPQPVLDAFTAEYGVKVTYLTYESQEEAAFQLRARKRCDVAVLELDVFPSLVNEGLLAEINFQNIPNFKNISPNFRDLAFDPGNAHSIPYGYGTTGLIVRTDLVKEPITRWADLWDPRYAGKIAVRGLPAELIGVTLKSLKYPLNSEDPQQLEAALQHMLDLKPIIVDDETPKPSPHCSVAKR